MRNNILILLMIKAIIIDDDEITCELISSYLSKNEGVILDRVFTNPIGAVSYIKENDIDLVFLDIEMPNINGIEFIQLTQKESISFILVSSHEKYAVKGFELDVIDYLQKPVSFSRLLESVEKYKKRNKNTVRLVEEKSEFIFLKKNGVLMKFKKDEIEFIKALGDYASVHIGKDKIIIHTTMAELEKSINYKNLVRVHRSYLVNISKIKNIQENTIIIGDEFIPMGNKYGDNLYKLITFI